MDYRIEAAGSGEEGLQALDRWADEGRETALVIADLWLREQSGVDFLIQVRERHGDAQRAIMVDYGDRTAAWPMLRALTLSQIDFRIVKPWVSPEEWLYRQVSEALGVWWREHRSTFEAVTLIGQQWMPRSHSLRDLLARNPVPYGFHPAESDEGRRLMVEHNLSDEQLPAAVLYDGRVLTNPSDVDVAAALGVLTTPSAETFDLAIVGAGPAGLAAAVYAASEGLRTLVIEQQAVGGQAGSSTMIRNYPGFPYGISGDDLAARTYEQARLFGAEFIFMRHAVSLTAREHTRVIMLADAGEVLSKSVLIATGVHERGLGVEALDRLYGAGVFYGSASAEARALEGDDVYVAGAGNSAAQAALHLARYARHVTLLCHDDSLTKTMSQYLIDAIDYFDNIEVCLRTQIADAHGDGRLRGLTVEHMDTKETERVNADAVFVLIGGDPRTDWLTPGLELDEHGYILTGHDLLHVSHRVVWPLERQPLPLETCLPGVFAAGDVRLGSTKRASSAAGEGAAAVGYIHQYLNEGPAMVNTPVASPRDSR
jgi:thioredoxin reductase (NADPH)